MGTVHQQRFDCNLLYKYSKILITSSARVIGPPKCKQKINNNPCQLHIKAHLDIHCKSTWLSADPNFSFVSLMFSIELLLIII